MKTMKTFITIIATIAVTLTNIASAQTSKTPGSGNLCSPVNIPIAINGKVVGAATLPVNTPVQVLDQAQDKVLIRTTANTIWVAASSVRITVAPKEMTSQPAPTVNATPTTTSNTTAAPSNTPPQTTALKVVISHCLTFGVGTIKLEDCYEGPMIATRLKELGYLVEDIDKRIGKTHKTAFNADGDIYYIAESQSYTLVQHPELLKDKTKLIITDSGADPKLIRQGKIIPSQTTPGKIQFNSGNGTEADIISLSYPKIKYDMTTGSQKVPQNRLAEANQFVERVVNLIVEKARVIQARKSK